MTYRPDFDLMRLVECTLLAGLAAILIGGHPMGAMQQAGAIIAGTVMSDLGQAVPGAMVVATPRVSGAELSNSRAYTSITSGDGTYHIDSVAMGEYMLCVQTGDERLLNTCRWPGTELLVKVDGTTRTSKADLKVDTGIVLRFRVDDPERLLATASRPNSAGVFLAGVWTKEGFFEPGRVRAEDKRGVDYVLTVPSTEKLRPYVDARNVRIVGESGALHKIGSLDVLNPDGKTKEILFRFRVTGAEVRKNQ